MAKVTGLLISIDASGAFADMMVYAAKWKGINSSRQYTIPGNPARPTKFKSVPLHDGGSGLAGRGSGN